MLPKHKKLAVYLSLTSKLLPGAHTFELCPHSHDNMTCHTDIVSVILHQTRCIYIVCIHAYSPI